MADDTETCSHSHLGPLLVIAIVGAVIVVSIVGALLLAGWNKPLVVVMAFITLTTNGVSLLIPSPLTKLQPQSVTVANAANDPVPTQPVGPPPDAAA